MNRFFSGVLRRSAVVLVFFYFAIVSRLHAQEFRAAWADVFHVGMGSTTEVNNMVSKLVSGHYNAVVVQVLGYMDNSTASHGAHWKSNIVPWSSRVTASFDPLAYLCTQAHANGIEVHAWLGGSAASMYRVSNSWPPAGNTTLASHPEWFISPLANSENGGDPVIIDGVFALDMGSPDAQEYIVSIVNELVTNYPIDGINWDDEMNGTGYNAGFGYPTRSQAEYPRSGLARYRINTGATGTPSNTDTAWSNYRRRYKNELLARVQAEIQSIKTNPRQPLRHTLSPIAYSPVPSGCSFTGSASYTYFTDWPTMMQNGWIDATIPQFYSSSTFNSWADRSVNCWQYNRHVFPGIGAYLNTDSTIASEITYTRSLGLKGNCIYSYAVPTSASGSGAGWWAYAAANVYTNVVGTPPMPWRNTNTATEGIVWGRVTDFNTGMPVDDATVAVTGGPTVKSDGNGYYIATLVPATAGGTSHSTTVSKTGMTSQTTNTVALAGDVVRYDLFLNAAAPTAPEITTQPASRTNTVGTTATFTVVATGAGLLYEWRKNGSALSNTGNVSGATTATLTLTNVALIDAASYSVKVTNSVGSVTSVVATLAVIDPPIISAQPQNQTIALSSNAIFNVTATGAATLSYQWRFSNANIGGATSSSYTKTNAQVGDAGSYSVVITNGFGAVTSANAVLTIAGTQPLLTLENIWNIQAGSRNYVTIQNTERGIALNHQTGHVLIVSRSAALSGSLGVFILDAATGAELGTMDVSTINNTGTFKLNKICVAADGIIYGVNLTTASGSSPLVIYRWANESAVPLPVYSGAPDGGATVRWGDSAAIRGAGTNTQIVVAGSSSMTAFLFTTSDGTNFSANLLTPSPAIAGGAFSRGIYFGETNSVYVKNRSTTTGTNFSYSLAGNSATAAFNVPGLDTNMLAIAVDTNHHLLFGVLDDNSTTVANHSLKAYDISIPSSPVVISNFTYLATTTGSSSNNPNFAASVDTDNDRIIGLDTQNGVVALRIVQTYPPGIATQPANQTNTVGASATFTVAATGTLPFGYQWRFNNASIASATNSSYTRSNLQISDAGSYSVVVTNSAGSATSSDAALTVNSVNSAPTITTQPQSLVVTQNNNAIFIVAANGTPPPTFQWRFNGANISGATTTSYTVTNAQPADAGSYSVAVTNVAGTSNSANAILTVRIPVSITVSPASQLAPLGSNVNFTVAAEGDPAPAFQWRFRGTNISGANNSVFQIIAAQGTNTGNYSVVVSNLVNTVTSANAHLTVITMPIHFESIAPFAGENFYLRGTGDPGTYQILATTNLSNTNWPTVTTIVNTNGIFEWTDSVAVPFQRYYRARLVP